MTTDGIEPATFRFVAQHLMQCAIAVPQQKRVPGIFPWAGGGGLKAASVPIILKSGSLNLLEPSGPAQACNGIALPLQGESRTPRKKREKLVKNLSNCISF